MAQLTDTELRDIVDNRCARDGVDPPEAIRVRMVDLCGQYDKSSPARAQRPQRSRISGDILDRSGAWQLAKPYLLPRSWAVDRS